MLNKMLQARYRYLQARRDLEYEQLKQQERLKPSLDVPKIVNLAEMEKHVVLASLACSTCGREFKFKKGLLSHLRNKTCEKIKD